MKQHTEKPTLPGNNCDDSPPTSVGGSASHPHVSMEDVDKRWEQMERVTERGQIWAASLGKMPVAEIHAMFPELKHIPLARFDD